MVWLHVASQTASMQQSHVETSHNYPSRILDAIRLQGLSIKTSAHWELRAEYAFSAAAGFSALRLGVSPFVQVKLVLQEFLISCPGVRPLVKCAVRGDTRVR